MKRRSASITNKIYPGLSLLAILALWEALSLFEIVPSFMLPSPAETVSAFAHDFGLLMSHSKVTLLETLAGTLEGMGFAELVNEADGTYQVTNAFHYIEQIILCINIDEDVKDEIPQ